MYDTILGVVRYASNGNPICEICGKDFKKPMSHVWQKHGISASEYKKSFGLDSSKGLLSPTSKALARQRVLENPKCISKNLLKHGKNTRFEKGFEGRKKSKVREQTRLVLKNLYKSTRVFKEKV